MAIEKKSNKKIFGIPLYHIVIGKKPGERNKMAIGFFALGRRAIGVFSIGQFAIGIFTLSQFGIGILFGLGQGLLGLGLTVAQGGIGFIALGQIAIGIFSIGQLAIGYRGTGQASLHYINDNWLFRIIDIEILSVETIVYYVIGVVITTFTVPAIFGLFFLIHWIINMILGSILEARYQSGDSSIRVSKATVKSIESTSIRINRQPVYKIRLTFRTAEAEKIELSIKKSLSTHEIFNIGEGSELKIAYHPKNPKRIIFV